MQVGNVRARMRHWGWLLLLGVLTGCAAAPRRQREEAPALGSARSFGSSPRILLAANDGPSITGESSERNVQGYNVPGRNTGSQAPWEFFLGNAAHRLIAYMYGVNYPSNRVFYNTKALVDILQESRLGAPSRLLPHERGLRPDITDVTAIATPSVFEIKPWNAQGFLEGRQEVQMYLSALNRAAVPGSLFMGGNGFQGQILVRFARGQYIWRLEWQTTEPGVVQYRWTRSQQRFESERAAYDAGQWVELSVDEMRQYGGWVGQAVEGMVARREQLTTVSEVVGIAIDVIGETAKGIFTGAILGRMSPGSETQQPPVQQGGGKVIPFPARPGAVTDSPALPRAVGR